MHPALMHLEKSLGRPVLGTTDSPARTTGPNSRREGLAGVRAPVLEACTCELRAWVSGTAGEDIARLLERALAGVGQSLGNAPDVVLEPVDGLVHRERAVDELARGHIEVRLVPLERDDDGDGVSNRVGRVDNDDDNDDEDEECDDDRESDEH